ncbi:MAG: TetR/AcrR family transcriptional regulator C-terminal domain-containing protein [Candidatus Nanopelagicales bacterium]|jgi:AcrR family transcriptional regulator|nr:TetR/AcrR family transcriptional regulator C-terminal domain-containing protein [Candidatus Nanopelagicales bacterium]MCU0299675.1 TetR/AcrR family transcriptional regulator C-terminal domain-containing protein [Candidatus Nanopelagicales bacterium]
MVKRSQPRRPPLTRERVLREAVALADEEGLSGVSMRRLGQRLNVEAMSLYNHVANKEDLLDGMADLVSEEFVVPTPGADWREALHVSATSAHDVLLRHPWAGSILESRTNPGPARLQYLNGVVGVLIDAGFPIQQVYLAVVTLDSYIYGFVLQETALPASPDEAAESAGAFVEGLPEGAYPHLVSMAEVVMDPDYDRSLDFEAGLTLLLEAIALRLPA